MSDIFVSYKRENLDAVAPLVDALRSEGFSVWWDQDIAADAPWEATIERQLEQANVVIVAWSPEAVASENVKAEARRAREWGRLLQVFVAPCLPPLFFGERNGVQLLGWRGDAAAPAWRNLLAGVADLMAARDSGAAPDAQSTSTIRRNSICVLPFVNISGDSEQEYFSDGMSEDIITDLSKVSALFVIARNTAFTFKGRSVDVPNVARQLNVSHVLEGSVRKSGGRVRITAQLIDGATGGHVWAERYDRDLTDVFALQDEIAEAIVTALKLKLLPQEKVRIERRGTSNVEAYELYLRGTRPAFGPDEQFARIALLEAATQLAPDYAEAWGELAKVRAFWHYSRPFAERDEIAKAISAEVGRALALDPRNLAAIGAQFYMLPSIGRFADAEVLVSRMQEIAPADADVLMRAASQLMGVGRVREGIDGAHRAYEADPLDPHRSNNRALFLLRGGRYGEARRVLEDLLSRGPEHLFAATNLLMVCIHTQDWTTVDALLAPDRLARYPLRQYERWARWYASIMRDESAESRRRPIDSARRRFEASGTADFFVLQLATKLGAVDDAYAIALRARFGPVGDDRDVIGIGAYSPGGLFDSIYPEFRRDRRFIGLCARVGLVDYWLATQQWPDCVDEVAPYYDFKAECAKVAAAPPLPLANEAGIP